MSKFIVGRQPIFDTQLRVHGYELLFRDIGDARPSGETMTAEVLVHAGLDMGLPSLVGDKLAFVNMTRAYLVGEHDLPFPPRQTVIDILEDVPRDAEVVAGCRRLAQNGYTLAADGRAIRHDEVDPLLELVSMIKVDVYGLAPDELPEAVRYCSAYGVKLIAKRVETQDQFDACKRLGFDLFQGYLLSRPEIVEGNSLSPSRLTCLRILEKLYDPNTSPEDVEDIVKTDASLSYRFLRIAGAGAARGLHRRVGSVREGVVLLGQRRLRAWVTLMLMADSHEGSEELLNIAMTRARMAELMAQKIDPKLSETAFTAGMVSALDLLLGVPLSEVLSSLSLTSELEDALLGGEGDLGNIVGDVQAWEVGSSEHLRSGLGEVSVAEAYTEGLAWAIEVCGALEASP
jgi:EAL and modified HD-GYP domain-containing signal transduction protein